MKVINYGSNYEIYANDLKTYDKLPAQTYNSTSQSISFSGSIITGIQRDLKSCRRVKAFGGSSPSSSVH